MKVRKRKRLLQVMGGYNASRNEHTYIVFLSPVKQPAPTKWLQVNSPIYLKEIIDAGGYAPQQIFNVDETGHFWKKMSEKTYISRKEKTMPGFKAAKNRFILMLSGIALADFKLKPLLVYRAENPLALKNIRKSCLPVIWKSNKKAWVTLAVLEELVFPPLYKWSQTVLPGKRHSFQDSPDLG